MSVDPFVIQAKHYGSAYATTDHRSKAHFMHLTASMHPSPHIQASATLSLTVSKAALDEVIMPDVSARLNGDLTHQDFTFPEMNQYSDLDYRILRLSLGVSWHLSPSVTLTADGDYADMSDNAGYVYDVESGSLFVIRSGIRYGF